MMINKFKTRVLEFLLVLSAVLASCDTSESDAEILTNQQFPITVEPEMIGPGALMEIRYNPQAPAATLDKSGLYEVSVNCLTECGPRAFKEIMLQDSVTQTFHSSVRLPVDAFFVNGAINVVGQPMKAESFQNVISQAGLPLKHSLPVLMLRGSKYDSALEIFAEDAKLYPQEFERWSALIMMTLKSGNNRNYMPQLLQELEADYIAHENSLQVPQRFDALSSLAAARAFNKDWEICLSILQELRALLKQVSPSYIHGRAQTSVAVLFKVFAFSRYAAEQESGKSLENRKNIESVLHILYELGGIMPGAHLGRDICYDLMMRPDTSSTADTDSYWKAMTGDMSVALATLADCDIRVDSRAFIIYIKKSNDFELAVDTTIVSAGIAALDKQPDGKPNLTWCAPSFSNDFNVRTANKLLAINLAQQNFHKRAIDYGLKALRLPLPSRSRDLAASVAFAVSENFMNIGQGDSAVKYCGIAAELEHRDADRLFTQIRSKAPQSVKNFGTIIDVRRHYAQDFASGSEVLDITLQTADDHLIDLADTKGKPVYLLFTSEACGICEDKFPGVAAAIHSIDESSIIVMLSYEESAAILSKYGAFVQHVPLNPILESQTAVTATPHIKIVVNGVVKHSIDGLGQQSAANLEQIAKTYSRETDR